MIALAESLPESLPAVDLHPSTAIPNDGTVFHNLLNSVTDLTIDAKQIHASLGGKRNHLAGGLSFKA